jgi:transposase-like protein
VHDGSKLGFESWLPGRHVTRNYALESLVIGSFWRGLSTRRVEAVLGGKFDARLASRSTLSRILESPGSAYRRW